MLEIYECIGFNWLDSSYKPGIFFWEWSIEEAPKQEKYMQNLCTSSMHDMDFSNQKFVYEGKESLRQQWLRNGYGLYLVIQDHNSLYRIVDLKTLLDGIEHGRKIIVVQIIEILLEEDLCTKVDLVYRRRSCT